MIEIQLLTRFHVEHLDEGLELPEGGIDPEQFGHALAFVFNGLTIGIVGYVQNGRTATVGACFGDIWRRMKFPAHRLSKRVLKAFYEIGFEEVLAHYPNNDRARRWLARLGFRRTGRVDVTGLEVMKCQVL